MVYFLGRDVEVFVTTESSQSDDSSVGITSREAKVVATGSAVFPSMENGASISGGLLSDVTGVDVSMVFQMKMLVHSSVKQAPTKFS